MGSEQGPQGSTDEEFLSRLQSEIEIWQRQRVVSPRQASSILAFCGLRHDVAERAWRLSRTAAIFATLGAILIAVGIILFVASNQGGTSDTPRVVQVGGLTLAVLVALAAGYYLRFETRFTMMGEGVLLIAAAGFGGAIFLAGQIYNIGANDPSLPLYWFLGVLPLAYVMRSRLALGLALITLGAWLGSRAVFSMRDTHSEELILVRTTVMLLMLGVMSYLLAPLHRSFRLTRDMSPPLQVIGLLTALAALLLLSFRFWFEDVARQRAGNIEVIGVPDSLLIVCGVAAALATAAVLWSLYIRGEAEPTLPLEGTAGVALLAIAFVTLFVPFEDENIYVLLFNVVLLVTILGAIPLGMAKRQEGYINVAVAMFAILVATRYFDLTWGLEERSFFFVGAGVLLLGGEWLLEYYRRRVVSTLREV